MNGFAPLIEGFLAFALTMLAMTAGVSSIVGSLHRLRRRHARGLRDMVRLLYDRELVPQLGPAWLEPPAPKPADPAPPSPPSLLERVWKNVVESVTPKPPVLTEEQIAQKRVADFAIEQRAEFIYDMTFMPVPYVVEKLKSKGPDYWRRKLTSAERLIGKPWYTTFFHPKRLARRWKTLGFVVEALPDAEFTDRLTKSDVGIALQKQLPSTPDGQLTPEGRATWDALVAELLRSFQTIGGASSETLARQSRGYSFAVGFVLAAALNVDSLDLLNSYLTNPDVRQRVLSQSDTILQATTPSDQQGAPSQTDQQGGAASTDQQASAQSKLAQLNANAAKLEDAAKGVSNTINSLAPKLDADGRIGLAKVSEELKSLTSDAQSVRTDAQTVRTEFTRTAQEIRGVTRSLGSSFPIGWKRFPNCSTDSPDLRCGGGIFDVNKLKPADYPWWYSLPVAVASVLPESVHTSVKDKTAMLVAASRDAPAEYSQWLVGVILTGLLLGLGTPFWVQAVTTAFNLQRWNRKPKDEDEEKTKKKENA
jgi:hypothetical protein